ncbi:MAG: PD-(D/E)XK nuclease family protein [Crocinitomicaceae bacterium]|nr:PD-(D/E)XK nuclease family protein [Crocinitomicaceae bacterium]
MKDFLEKLYEIEQNSIEDIDNETMNIFNVLYNGNEEVTLHSRFISYLLSLKDKNFLKLFVKEILKLEEEKFNVNNCEIIPNEQNKTEYEEIDILILNENEKQAIIIENKINADDSIHPNARRGYKGQLERYFNTITKGKDKNVKDCKYKCDVDKTYIYYLTLYKKPSDKTIGELKERNKFITEKHIINYYQIQEWLSLCIENTEKSFLKTIIQQYLNLIKKMTTDNKRALELTDLISISENYWESAYIFSEYFKDIKWHTIHRFFTELSEKLKTHLPDEKLITDVAHNGNRKTILKIEFEYLNTRLQIVNDDNGFTLGNLTKGTWGYFSDDIKKIRFWDFANKETFHIINNVHRTAIIDNMLKQIEIHHKEDYKNLKNVFKLS